jgi:hypothetical protein
MGQHSGNKHMLIMLLCCLVPLAIVFAVTTLGVPLGNIATFALVLMCPLMHLFMMKGMMGHGAQDQGACHDAKGDAARPLPNREG